MPRDTPQAEQKLPANQDLASPPRDHAAVLPAESLPVGSVGHFITAHESWQSQLLGCPGNRDGIALTTCDGPGGAGADATQNTQTMKSVYQHPDTSERHSQLRASVSRNMRLRVEMESVVAFSACPGHELRKEISLRPEEGPLVAGLAGKVHQLTLSCL